MVRRKLALVILMVGICFCMVFANSSYAQPKKTVKIGLMYDLTGIYAPMGKDSQNAANTWLELINAKGGIKGHPVEFVALDGQSDPTKATLVAKRLIEEEKVYAIAGSNGTGVALAVGPVCEKARIPYVTATGSEIFEYTLKPQWSFRACTTGWELVDWGFGSLKLLDAKINNIAVLYQGGAFGKALYDMAARYAPMRGLKIVAVEKYDPTGTDFGAQISALMKANPDAVCVYTADTAGPLAIKQMREMGMDKPVMTNGAINMKAIREAFKDAFSIPRYTYSAAQHADVWWQLPKESPEYKAVAPIASRYEKKYNEQYGWFQQIAINDLALIENAIDRGLKDDPNLLNRDVDTVRKVIRDKIETTKDLHTGGGILTLTPSNHNAVIPGTAMATFHFEKGKIVYDPELSKVKLNPPPPVPQ
ncbi:MAG: ABC transporter substrate-binding protein [Syntrophorhabdales bacterium]